MYCALNPYPGYIHWPVIIREYSWKVELFENKHMYNVEERYKLEPFDWVDDERIRV